MKTATVISAGNQHIVLNEKFLPGLIAGALIYWCEEHQAYHVRDDHDEEAAEKIVRDAAACNDMPAWADGQPLNHDASAPVKSAVPHYSMQFFAYEHLPPYLQAVSKPFGDLAREMDALLPNNPEKSAMLRHLLEAKDSGVRALLFKADHPEFAR